MPMRGARPQGDGNTKTWKRSKGEMMRIEMTATVEIRPAHFADDEPSIVFRQGEHYPYQQPFIWFLECGYAVPYYV